MKIFLELLVLFCYDKTLCLSTPQISTNSLRPSIPFFLTGDFSLPECERNHHVERSEATAVNARTI